MTRKWTSSGSLVNIWTVPSDPIQELIAGLTTDGVFTKLDRLWIFAQATEALALVDLVASATATAVNSPAFVANRGYTGQDLTTPTQYIDSGYTPGTNYTLNSAHVSAWCVTAIGTPTNGGAMLGNYESGGALTDIHDPFVDANNLFRINDGSFSGDAGIPASTQGHFIGNRTGASTSNGWRNGAKIADVDQAAAATLQTANFFILCVKNASGSPTSGYPGQLAMASMGGGLTTTDAANFYTRLRTYMTAVGVP